MIFTLRGASGLGFAPTLSPNMREGEEDSPLCPQAHLKKVTVQSRVVTREPTMMDPGGGVSGLFPDSSWRSRDTLFTSGLSSSSLSFLGRQTQHCRAEGSLQGREGRGEGPATVSQPPARPVSLQSPGQGGRQLGSGRPWEETRKVQAASPGLRWKEERASRFTVIQGSGCRHILQGQLPFSLLPNARGMPQSTEVTKFLWESK